MLALLVAFFVAAVVTPLVRGVATHLGVVDRPDGGRKTHHRPTALLGGVALFVALAITIVIAVYAGWLPGLHIKEKYLLGILIAALLLVIGGALDDRFDLPPLRQIIWPILAAAVIVTSGVGIAYVTNPLGGQLHLDRFSVTVLWWQGIPYHFTFLADVFAFLWLLSMTYTTKLLDGLDGLVSGVTAIGAIIIAFVSITRDVAQPDTAILALIVAGIFLGFLLSNFQPATIFLGEGGSTLAGFLLGTLAIISGGKIATTMLVFGLPLFDAAFVILRRLVWERRSPTSADRSHLHFRLLDLGFSPRQVVLFYYFIAAMFGVSTFVLQGWEKLIAIGMLASIIVIATAVAMIVFKKRLRS